MKIELDNSETLFKPVIVKFTIESQQELEAIQSMSTLNMSIAQQLPELSKKHIVWKFLDMLRQEIIHLE